MTEDLKDIIMTEFSNLYSECLAGFSIGNGWLQEVYNLSKEISENFPDIKILQVKEKFGDLRIYYAPYSDTADQMIQNTETACSKICEQCGSKIEVHKSGKFWTKTLCKFHREEQKRHDDKY